jgi:hypothetical protein
MIRSAAIALIFAGLVSALALGLSNPPPVEAGPLFRILDVRQEYGHLIIEVEHFKADGSFWFFEDYTWQGREGLKRSRVKNADGELLLATGKVAAFRLGDRNEKRHFLRRGERWKLTRTPMMTTDSILGVVQKIHAQRVTTGWTKGQSRIIVSPKEYKTDDTDGVGQLVTKFRGLKDTAWLPNPLGPPRAFVGILPPPHPGNGRLAYGTVTTFYPSLDGVVQETEYVSWATLVGAAGDAATANPAAYSFSRWYAHTVTDVWTNIRRSIFLFDTSAIDDTATIDAVTMSIYMITKGNGMGGTPTYNIVTSAPASNTGLVGADYATLGQTAQSDANISHASMNTGVVTDNDWVFNSTGRGNISVTTISKFAGREMTYDCTSCSSQSWVSGGETWMNSYFVNEAEPQDVRPRLIVTYTVPPTAAITGTIGDGATEKEVRDGGGTIIITLTGDTWVTTGATFDAQRQNIIDGLDAAESEATGWNAEVRDQIGVASVVRTSDTVTTVTIAAADVGGYRIDSNEVVTVTVPAGALTTHGSSIVATPTFTITAGVESMAITGTLGGSGGTPAEIRAGGETIIATLTNTAWVADGSTFNAQRQNIIDGLTSNLSDQNGWDNRRGDFAVTDVVRTSASVVTITLSASSAYAIPSTETITAVAPASALVFSGALTGVPTFEIVPAFVLSGNRTSDAIDLSSITDVAYCAIGWQASTPANTTVTVKTSIDGGTNYSSATNGSCPTGITVGGSLSTITDFRIQVDLVTTDDAVTPLVEGLALLVQDTSGPALYYQLNTVPGVTITDRSANSNTGTMSFPINQASISSTTGVLESTRSSLSLEQLLSVGDIVSPVTGAAVAGNIFNQTETGFGSLPFQGMVETMATGGELPLKFVWVVAIGLFSIALGVVALHLTGSLMISGIGMGAGLSVGAAIGAGLIPGWTVILFVILALALIVMRSRGALPL